MTPELFAIPPADAFVELPGMRGLRVARVGHADGKTLEVIDAVKGVVIPARTNPGREQGKVISGSLRFVRGQEATVLEAGDGWDVPGGEAQGPHLVLEENTRVVILRDGDAALG